MRRDKELARRPVLSSPGGGVVVKQICVIGGAETGVSVSRKIAELLASVYLLPTKSHHPHIREEKRFRQK
jgi:hypothetical protein